VITLIVGTNRPGSNTRKVATHVEEIYAELKVPLRVLDLAKMPQEIFSPGSYGEKPKSFQPFADGVLASLRPARRDARIQRRHPRRAQVFH
jgi:NAD(P)H-dependent FMN reductase